MLKLPLACGLTAMLLIVTPGSGLNAAAPTETPAYFRTGVLTQADRVWAQTQIERVYYNHRIWPKENPGPKPAFEQMVPLALIEKKAMSLSQVH